MSNTTPSSSFWRVAISSVSWRSRRQAFVAEAIALLLCTGCSSGSHGVTYGHDIEPLLAGRCTTCHRPGGPSGVDMRNPYSTEPPPDVGLVNALNQWKVRDPSLDVPDHDVQPGDPDDSFLIYKISDPSSSPLPPDPDGPQGPQVGAAGSHMPLQVPALSELEKELLEDWIFAGAPNGPFMDRGDRLTPQSRMPAARSFDDDIQPIFGFEDKLNEEHGVCPPGQATCAHCIYCHYAGAPNPPNLSDVFGLDGLVGVDSIIHPGMKRVAPGDPDQSLLVVKIRQDQTVTEYGAQMPYSYLSLNADQVALVRQWIEEGARP